MKYKLKDIGKVVTGCTPKTKNEEYYSNKDYLFIGPTDIKSCKYVRKTEKYISNIAYREYSSRFINKNSIMVDCIGSDMGNVALSINEVLTNQQINSITEIDENKFNVEYIFYVLSTMKKYFHQIGTNGSTMPIINKTMFEEIEIEIPEKNIQNKIASILSKMDKKIELNNKINDNLYELSQELFKRWFVDFEFPNSDGLEYKSANGTFKEVNGEQIPVDWQIMRLDEVAECQNGNAFYKDGYDESGIMVVDLGNVNINGSFIYTNADKYISQARLQSNSKYSKYRLYKNDLVMVMTDRKATMDLLGKTGKIYENKQYLLNQRMYRIRSKINVNYLYTVLNSSKILNELKSRALGSVQKYVNTGHINELKIVVGTDAIMEKFSQIVNPIFERIENNILENDSLQKLRDTLLPKLMNGEIDLKNVEI